MAGLFMVIFFVSVVAGYESSEEFGGGSSSVATRFWEWLPFGVLGLEYLAAIVVASRRPTRRLGQGMLIGLTVMWPFAFAIVVVVFFSML